MPFFIVIAVKTSNLKFFLNLDATAYITMPYIRFLITCNLWGLTATDIPATFVLYDRMELSDTEKCDFKVFEAARSEFRAMRDITSRSSVYM
jgi:hypothetical protein